MRAASQNDFGRSQLLHAITCTTLIKLSERALAARTAAPAAARGYRTLGLIGVYSGRAEVLGRELCSWSIKTGVIEKRSASVLAER